MLQREAPSCTFYGGNVLYVFLFSAFSLPLIFIVLTLVAAGISHFLTAAIKLLYQFLQTKLVSVDFYFSL